MTQPPTTDRRKAGLNEYVFGGVIVLSVFFILMATLLFLAPGNNSQTPELNPVLRVTREADFPIGASRVVTWGPQSVLVVHNKEGEYSALEGSSPLDGCTLTWDAVASQVTSPCADVVYDLHGNVVHGLTTTPLRRYAVFLQEGTVFVRER